MLRLAQHDVSHTLSVPMFKGRDRGLYPEGGSSERVWLQVQGSEDRPDISSADGGDACIGVRGATADCRALKWRVKAEIGYRSVSLETGGTDSAMRKEDQLGGSRGFIEGTVPDISSQACNAG